MDKAKRETLLRCLCELLPHNAEIRVFQDTIGGTPKPMRGKLIAVNIPKGHCEVLFENTVCFIPIEKATPILRPIEDMTDDEIKEYNIMSALDDEYYQPYDSKHLIDWLNARKIDHRNLIRAGLAVHEHEM